VLNVYATEAGALVFQLADILTPDQLAIWRVNSTLLRPVRGNLRQCPRGGGLSSARITQMHAPETINLATFYARHSDEQLST